MRTGLILAAAAVVALVLALITGWTVAAIAVVALAGAGITALLREWRADRAAAPPPLPPAQQTHPLSPDEFAPDISTDPDGPSSDARADQG